jgi:hypothetical protein
MGKYNRIEYIDTKMIMKGGNEKQRFTEMRRKGENMIERGENEILC